MQDEVEAKEQLLKEIAGLRQRVAELETSQTQLKRAEEKLRESEDRFRATADYAYDWENWFDVKGKLVWVNPAVFRITGYAIDEWVAMIDYPLALVDRKDRDRFAGCFTKAVRGSSGHDVEFRIRCKDGSTKWVAASWQPIYDGKGISLGRRSSIRVITEGKRALDSIAHLASFPDLNPNPIIEVDSSGEITFFNEAAVKALQGMDMSEKDLKAFFPESLSACLQDQIRGHKPTLTCEVVIKDRLFSETIYFALPYDTARIYAVDITEYRRMEEESRELLSAVGV